MQTIATPQFDVSEAPAPASSLDAFVFVDHPGAAGHDVDPFEAGTPEASSPRRAPVDTSPEANPSTAAATKRAPARGPIRAYYTVATAAVFVVVAASLQLASLSPFAMERPKFHSPPLLCTPPALLCLPAPAPPIAHLALPWSGGERAGRQLLVLPSQLHPSPQPVAQWLLSALLVLVLLVSLSGKPQGEDHAARASGTAPTPPLVPESAPPSPLAQPTAKPNAKPNAQAPPPRTPTKNPPAAISATTAAAITATTAAASHPASHGRNSWNDFQRRLARRGFTPAEVSQMYAALREAKTCDCEINREIDPAPAAATAAATPAATPAALMPMTSSCAQRSRSRSRPASLPSKLDLQPDDGATPADADAPSSPASPASPWNAFQKAVRGRGLSKPQVCHMYAALKQAPARHLSWNGFQQHCGGKGYTKATLSQMYASCKSAERHLFEEASSRAR
jgi:hypothetical protein